MRHANVDDISSKMQLGKIIGLVNKSALNKKERPWKFSST